MQSANWLCVLIIFNVVILLQGFVPWSKKQQFPSERIPDGALNTDRRVVQDKIVMYHNFFRTKVSPPASNMLEMSWHPLAAEQAQKYAEACVYLHHNEGHEREDPKLGNCGQNLFVATHKTPWFFVLKSWFLEYEIFTYGAPILDLKAVGHYTQMVWATTHKVGCGVALCPGGLLNGKQYYNYVCHYCPGGNYDTITQFPYKVGKPCSDCPNDCSWNGTLCTNTCSEVDRFNNCDEFLRYNNNDCNSTESNNCKATCVCGNSKLHKNYPFK